MKRGFWRERAKEEEICAHCNSKIFQPKDVKDKLNDQAMQKVRVGCSKCGKPVCFSCAATEADRLGKEGNCFCPECGAELGHGGEAGNIGEHFGGWDSLDSGSGFPRTGSVATDNEIVTIDNRTARDNWIVNTTDMRITVACDQQQAGKFSINLQPGERQRVAPHIKAQPYPYGKQKYDRFEYKLKLSETWEVCLVSDQLQMEQQAETEKKLISVHDIDKPFLMPVEDVFNISGRGTVVTGRVEQGKIHVGDEVEIVGSHTTKKTVVTGVEMYRKLLDECQAGDNVGLLLRNIGRDEIEHGQVIAAPGSITAEDLDRGSLT